MNRHFFRGETETASKHMNRCSTALVIREVQIAATMRYHYNLLECLKQTTSSAGKDVEQMELSGIAVGNAKLYRYFGKQLGILL